MRVVAFIGLVAIGLLLRWGLCLIRNASVQDQRMHEAWLDRERKRQLREAAQRDGEVP